MVADERDDLFSPSIYAIANLNDISWGTKGLELAQAHAPAGVSMRAKRLDEDNIADGTGYIRQSNNNARYKTKYKTKRDKLRQDT